MCVFDKQAIRGVKGGLGTGSGSSSGSSSNAFNNSWSSRSRAVPAHVSVYGQPSCGYALHRLLLTSAPLLLPLQQVWVTFTAETNAALAKVGATTLDVLVNPVPWQFTLAAWLVQVRPRAHCIPTRLAVCVLLAGVQVVLWLLSLDFLCDKLRVTFNCTFAVVCTS